MSQSPISIKNLKFGYTKDRLILDDLNLDFESGLVTSILGTNGSCKTTTLKLILGLLKPIEGQIFIHGRDNNQIDLKERAKLLAYVPQKHNAVFDYKVIDVVAMGRVAYSNLFATTNRQDKEIAFESLEKMGISHLGEKAYTQISGGEQQMALIARALAQQAKILILDEPVTGLDYGNQINLLKTLRDLSKEGITSIMTTHYPEHALWVSDEAVFMKKGRVVAKGSTQNVITSSNLKAIYNTDIAILHRPLDTSALSTCLPLF